MVEEKKVEREGLSIRTKPINRNQFSLFPFPFSFPCSSARALCLPLACSALHRAPSWIRIKESV